MLSGVGLISAETKAAWSAITGFSVLAFPVDVDAGFGVTPCGYTVQYAAGKRNC